MIDSSYSTIMDGFVPGGSSLYPTSSPSLHLTTASHLIMSTPKEPLAPIVNKQGVVEWKQLPWGFQCRRVKVLAAVLLSLSDRFRSIILALSVRGKSRMRSQCSAGTGMALMVSLEDERRVAMGSA